jgi:hypothetical protein
MFLNGWHHYEPSSLDNGCPQVDALAPQLGADLLANISDLLATDDFKTKTISWLSGAVQVPCVFVSTFRAERIIGVFAGRRYLTGCRP